MTHHGHVLGVDTYPQIVGVAVMKIKSTPTIITRFGNGVAVITNHNMNCFINVNGSV